jgi:hypothetical protein
MQGQLAVADDRKSCEPDKEAAERVAHCPGEELTTQYPKMSNLERISDYPVFRG